jgi:hypothetical protein
VAKLTCSSRERSPSVQLDNLEGVRAFLCDFKNEVPDPDYSKPKKYIQQELKNFEKLFAQLDPAKRNKVARALFECVLTYSTLR